MIRVNVKKDRMGNVLISPVSKNYKNVFIQQGFGAVEFSEQVPKNKRNNFENGWKIGMLFDPWELEHLAGYAKG